jgi:hypothetical protein
VDTVRLARLEYQISIGDIAAARADTAQLEASAPSLDERAVLLRKVAGRFAQEGHEGEAIELLRRALRLTPEDAEVMMALALLLDQAGKSLRAAELLSSAIRTFESEIAQLLAPNEHQQRSALLHRCHFALAKILLAARPAAPEVLLHLGAIPTRSVHGAEARLLEAEVFQSRGNRHDRDHCLSRLVEAVQLGWIDPERLAIQLARMLDSFSPAPDSELIACLLPSDRNAAAEDPEGAPYRTSET